MPKGRAIILGQLGRPHEHNGKSIPARKPPTSLYANHLAPIWPRYQISFPPPPAVAITGAFTVDGGTAREIATRFQTQLASKLAAMGIRV